MSSDTSLVFKLVPLDLGVGAMLRKAAAETAVLNQANQRGIPAMQKVGAEANKLSANMEKAAKSNNAFSRASASVRRAAVDVEKAEGRINKAFRSLSGGSARTAGDIERGSRRIADVVGNGARKASREVFKIDNVFRSTARRWASMIALIGFLVVGLIGHAVAFAHAVWQVVGVLAAVPAVAFAAVAGLGSLLMIFKGLPAAMQKAGGGGANTADQIAQATRRYEMAQRSAIDAQNDLNRARQDAARALQNMDRELRKANLDERSGALAVKEAQLELRRARSSGNRLEREGAQIGYEQALISLDEIRERNADLRKEEADRAAKGVEGSDEVQQALQRQSDALYELAQAQKALSEGAGGGGASAAAEAYAKLSDAGKSLVDTLKSLAPPWRVVQKEMQQAALVNVAGDVKGVSDVLLAQKGHLVGIAAAWNTAFRGVLGYFKSAEGAKDLDKTLGNTVVLSQHLGNSWRPFVHGFMQFVTAGSDFLPRLGAWIEKLANQFDRWATNAEKSGKIAGWIETGAKAAADLGHWIRDIVGGVGEIFKAGSGGPNYLENLATSAEKWRATMATPEMQGQLAAFFEASRQAGSALWVVIKALVDGITNSPGIIKEAAGALNIIGWALKFAADHADTLKVIMPVLLTFFAVRKIAMFANGVTTLVRVLGVWKYVQMLLNVQLWLSPITWIVIGIIALIAAIILAIKYHEEIGRFFVMVWGKVLGAIQGVWHWIQDNWKLLLVIITGPFGLAFVWITDHWDQILDFFKGIPDKVTSALRTVGDAISAPFKAAFEAVKRFWNDNIGGKGFDVPSWVPFGAGGKSFRFPTFHSGGIVPQTPSGEMLALLQTGERITPAAQAKPTPGGAQRVVVELEISGADDEMTRALRKMIRVKGAKSFGLAPA